MTSWTYEVSGAGLHSDKTLLMETSFGLFACTPWWFIGGHLSCCGFSSVEHLW